MIVRKTDELIALEQPVWNSQKRQVIACNLTFARLCRRHCLRHHIWGAPRLRLYTLRPQRRTCQTYRRKYPDVKFVYGDLDSVDMIEKAASEADIVVRMSNRQTKLLTGNLHDSQILQIQQTHLEQPKQSQLALPLVTRPRTQDTTFISQAQASSPGMISRTSATENRLFLIKSTTTSQISS